MRATLLVSNNGPKIALAKRSKILRAKLRQEALTRLEQEVPVWVKLEAFPKLEQGGSMGILRNRLWVWNSYTKEWTLKPPLSFFAAFVVVAGVLSAIASLISVIF